jgi:hypothetical protein
MRGGRGEVIAVRAPTQQKAQTSIFCTLKEDTPGESSAGSLYNVKYEDGNVEDLRKQDLLPLIVKGKTIAQVSAAPVDQHGDSADANVDANAKPMKTNAPEPLRSKRTRKPRVLFTHDFLGETGSGICHKRRENDNHVQCVQPQPQPCNASRSSTTNGRMNASAMRAEAHTAAASRERAKMTNASCNGKHLSQYKTPSRISLRCLAESGVGVHASVNLVQKYFGCM